MQGLGYLLPHTIGKLFVVRVELVAGFSRNDEARRHRQTRARHLAEARAFAAEQSFVIAAAFFE